VLHGGIQALQHQADEVMGEGPVRGIALQGHRDGERLELADEDRDAPAAVVAQHDEVVADRALVLVYVDADDLDFFLVQ